MPQRFFELHDDVHFRDRWHLKNPIDSQGRKVEDWDFRLGTPVRVDERLKISIEHEGRPLDFSETNSRIPVVHIKVATLLSELAPDDVQLIPVDIEGQPDQYLVLVATRRPRCIDEKASKVQFWQQSEGGQGPGVPSGRMGGSRRGSTPGQIAPGEMRIDPP